MKKFALYFVVLLIIAFFNTACKDENNGPAIGFASASSTVIEGNSVSIKFTIPIPDGERPRLSFGGSAKENTDFSYQISADGTEMKIRTVADNSFDDETIEVKITSFANGKATVGETTTHTIKIEDPSLFVKLNWSGANDMNLVLWKISSDGNDASFVKASEFSDGNEEYLTLPGSASDGIYGLTFQYHSGTASTLVFTVTVSTTAGTIEGSEKKKTFTAAYTAANKNSTYTVNIEQLFIKDKNDYNTFLDIFIPDSGSRIGNASTLTGLEIPFN